MQGRKRIATTSVIICSLLLVVFFVLYQDYANSYLEEEQIIKKYNEVEIRKNKTIYRSLKDETQTKVNRLAIDIRDDLIKKYSGDLSQFELEYDSPKNDTVLVDTVDTTLQSSLNEFFYVETENNTMFALTGGHVITDDKIADDLYVDERTIDQYIDGNVNPKSMRNVYNLMVRGTPKDLFKNNGKVSDTCLDINKILEKPIAELRDIVFLSYSFIDKNQDLLGNTYKYKSGGVNENNKKIVIVQRFSLYEQAQERFGEEYLLLEANKRKDIAVVQEKRSNLMFRIVTITALIFISFYAISSLQYVDMRTNKDEKKEH